MHIGVHHAGPGNGREDGTGTCHDRLLLTSFELTRPQQCTRQAEKFPRYRQKLESVGRLLHGAIFVDDPDFNVMNHIHVRRLPEPAGKKELEALVRQTGRPAAPMEHI